MYRATSTLSPIMRLGVNLLWSRFAFGTSLLRNNSQSKKSYINGRLTGYLPTRETVAIKRSSKNNSFRKKGQLKAPANRLMAQMILKPGYSLISTKQFL